MKPRTVVRTKQFTSKQPRDGDTVVHCGHLEADRHHFYDPGRVDFVRPDGTTGSARWIAVCNTCHFQSGGDVSKMNLKGDGKWHGDAPAIEAVFND